MQRILKILDKVQRKLQEVLDQQVALESANVSLETVLFLPSDESKPS